MQDLEMKQKVAKEIMDLMDQMEGDRLKKHPKVMGASIEIEKKEPMMASDPEEIAESPEAKAVEDSEDGEEMELSPEMIEKILAMMKEK